MINKETHIVRKCTIDLKLSSQKRAVEMRHKLNQLYQTEIQPMLAQILDELEEEGKVIEIPKLELDLGTILIDNFEKEFTKEYIFSLKQALQKYVVPQLITKNSQHSPLSSFLYFLKNGSLPWNSRFNKLEALELDVIEAFPLQANFIKNRLIQIAAKQPRIITRLIHQFSDQFLYRLLVEVWQVQETSIQLFLAKLSMLLQKDFRTEERENAIKAILGYLIGGNEFSPHNILKNIQAQLNNSNTKVLRDSIYQIIFEKRDLQKLVNKVESKEGLIEESSADRKSTNITHNNEWYIENAGLVILAYFLNPFFKGLGLLAENDFVDKESQYKAIHLTYFLVTNTVQPAEFSLPLNKLLCGLPMDETLARHLDISEAEKEEAHHLLQAVIKHWNILGNTSIEALRNTFLKRRGKLSYEYESKTWLLQVEKKGYDICIEKLPWTIAVVKLPWMPDRLQVVWV